MLLIKLRIFKDYAKSLINPLVLFDALILAKAAALFAFTLYFFNALNMSEKILTLAISGKVPGTTYFLKLRDVVIVGIIILSLAVLYLSTRLIIKINKARRKSKTSFKSQRAEPSKIKQSKGRYGLGTKTA
jgi:predicted membrane protein